MNYRSENKKKTPTTNNQQANSKTGTTTTTTQKGVHPKKYLHISVCLKRPSMT
jgi:hypothetical protein